MSKKRLVELLKKAKQREKIDLLFADIDTAIDMLREEEYIADYLLANGVIVVPDFAAYKTQNVITPECITQALEFMKSNRPIPDFRREVAFARLFAEEAEAKLKESKGK